jgi:O-antigen ligase
MYDKLKDPHKLLYVLYLVFLVSVVGAFRAVSSISIGLIVAVSFIQNKKLTGAWFNRNLRNPFFITCSFFFLLQLIPLAYAGNFYEGWKHVQVKSALLFIPLFFYSCAFLNKVNFHSLMIACIYIVAVLLTWCLGVSCIKYLFHHAPVTVFFYHQLVSDLGHHAVQFSILVFTGLMYLLHMANRNTHLVNKSFHFFITAYFIIGIFLLSSKLVIIFTLVYLAYYLFTLLRKKFSTRTAIAIAAITGIIGISSILLTQNPVSRRFNDILHGNIAIILQPSFNRGNYFNGVQFRLLQWRFVKEILDENKAWLFGVTPAAAQPLLNQKYISTHMYTGVPGSATQGYLNYNTHNQFLEALLQTGIVGLLCFMAICFHLIGMAVRQKNRLSGTLVLLLLAYACSDAVFETQYGLVLFIFLPLFFYAGHSGSYPPAPEE